jgi:hypothetical protein
MLFGVVMFGLVVLVSCQVDADKLAAKIAEDLKKQNPYRQTYGVGDDQPIVVAGGSINFIAPSGYAFVADAVTKSLRYTAPVGTAIIKVDVIDFNDTDNSYTIGSGTDPNIQITYDKKKGGGGNDPETVTISAPAGADLLITADKTDMSTSHMNSDRFWSHPKKHKSMSKVQVGVNPAVSCGNDGECSVVIHYCTTAPGVKCSYH